MCRNRGGFFLLLCLLVWRPAQLHPQEVPLSLEELTMLEQFLTESRQDKQNLRSLAARLKTESTALQKEVSELRQSAETSKALSVSLNQQLTSQRLETRDLRSSYENYVHDISKELAEKDDHIAQQNTEIAKIKGQRMALVITVAVLGLCIIVGIAAVAAWFIRTF